MTVHEHQSYQQPHDNHYFKLPELVMEVDIFDVGRDGALDNSMVVVASSTWQAVPAFLAQDPVDS